MTLKMQILYCLIYIYSYICHLLSQCVHVTERLSCVKRNVDIGVVHQTCTSCNINGRDFQRKNVVKSVDKSNLWAL